MKQFLKKLLLFLLLFALACGALNLAFFLYMGRMTPAYTDRFTNAPTGIQVANLGSSHGQSCFCYDNASGLVAANFGFSKQTYVYDLHILENYIDHFSEGSLLYIPVSYFSFFVLADENDGRETLSLNQRYYHILPREMIQDFSWIEWLTSKLPGLSVSNWRSAYWRSDEFNVARLRTAVRADMPTHAEKVINDHILRYQCAEGYRFNEQEIGYLVEIIRLCKAHDITPVLITVPFLSELTARVPADFLAGQQAIIDRICAAEDVRYLDFSRDRRFTDRYDLFINTDHLNHHGALLFTDLLLSGALPEE